MLAFLHTYGRAAPVEATTIFDLSPGAYEALAGRLEAEHRMRRVPAGNGYFLELAAGAVCDMESGTCAM